MDVVVVNVVVVVIVVVVVDVVVVGVVEVERVRVGECQKAMGIGKAARKGVAERRKVVGVVEVTLKLIMNVVGSVKLKLIDCLVVVG